MWPRREPGVRPLLLVRPVEHEIAVQEDVERLARADGDRGRHVEPAPEDLEGHARELLAEGTSGDLTRRWRRERARLLWLAHLGAGANGREEERLPEDALPVRVHLALRPGLAGEVLQGQAREPQTAAVGENEPRPRDEETVLARRSSAWGVFLSVAVSAVAGYVVLVALTLKMTSPADVVANSPGGFGVQYILEQNLGAGLTALGGLLAAGVAFAMTFCSAKTRPYSITSSARSRIDSGIVRPIALAALRLTTNSNFVGTVPAIR